MFPETFFFHNQSAYHIWSTIYLGTIFIIYHKTWRWELFGLETSKESYKTYYLFFLNLIKMFPGEGNGNPLQCSCLENPRDGGAWWATIYGVAQSRTRLKWLSSSSMDCSSPGSSVHGILQERVLEWVAISFSRGSSPARDQTRVSYTAGGFFTTSATQEAHISLIFFKVNLNLPVKWFAGADLFHKLLRRIPC